MHSAPSHVFCREIGHKSSPTGSGSILAELAGSATRLHLESDFARSGFGFLNLLDASTLCTQLAARALGSPGLDDSSRGATRGWLREVRIAARMLAINHALSLIGK